jgi:inner membrane protein
MEKPSVFDRINNWIKNSVSIKLLSIGILILILLIPTSMLESLIRERQDVRDAAIDEVSSKWGLRQTIGGPVLTIPYLVQTKDQQGNIQSEKRYAHFLPEQLNINGEVLPEKRYRGIYVVVLYKTVLHVTGKFIHPDVTELGLAESSCFFDQAFISLGISDLKGVNEEVKVKMNDVDFVFGPGIPSHDILTSGMSFKYPLAKTGDIHPVGQTSNEVNFNFDIDLNGSTNLSFLPFGKQTKVSLKSSWDSPSFEGFTLPVKRTVNESGFTADWKVLQLNRNYPQQGLGDFIENQSKNIDNSSGSSSFGVRLMLPVDEYLKTMRSVKYCLMFIVLTFLTFFFVEVLNKKRIHPIQYLLVGSAICLFYVLLLSISEHLTFGKAYLIGCVAIVSIVTFYVKYIFQKSSLTAVFSSVLLLLYGFFYSLLQLEDYSLLLGSIGLFMILATIMYLTRKVNWYREN